MQRPHATSTHADQPGRVNSGIQQVPDLLIVVFFELCLWERNAEASREERHLEVNCELATRSRHSQRSLNFLNLFIKKLTRDRVVPIISARVS
jgi:hypothetical protein